VILAGLIQGVPVRDGGYAGGSFHWATPFALLCGLALIAGYGLLGATWLRYEDARSGGGTRPLAKRRYCCWRFSHLWPS